MLNKIMLIGRLGRDPETRYMPDGTAVTTFSLATDEKWKDKQEKIQSRTEWHNIKLFSKLSEIASKFLQKGSLIYIEGRIQSHKYTDKNGIERTSYEIIGKEMKMLSYKDDNSSSTKQQNSDSSPTTEPADIDDDIPF